MKPSEMSNEELAGEVMRTNSAYLSRKEADVLLEAAARLRNSIPKPVVEVVVCKVEGPTVHPDNYWGWIVVNGVKINPLGDLMVVDCRKSAGRLRTALGINDTEGGV